MIWHNFIFSNRPFFRLGRHVAFWLVFAIWYLFLCVGFGDSLSYYAEVLPILYSILPVSIISTYTTLYHLIPRYLLVRKYEKFVTAVITLSIIYPILVIVDPVTLILNHGQYVADRAFIFDHVFDQRDIIRVKNGFWDGWGFGLAVAGFASVIKLMKNYYLENSKNEVLQQQKNNHELQLLKSQLNSRFLFDALHSIQKNITNRSPSSSVMIIELSDLLSYILYENEETTVPLSKEIEIIEGYLNLERAGHDNPINIKVTKHGQVNDKRIVPLVLLSLIESCFEDSPGRQYDGTGLSVDFTVNEFALLVTLTVSSKRHFSDELFQKSLRVKNVKHLLEKHYSERHAIKMTEENQSYVVHLKMAL